MKNFPIIDADGHVTESLESLKKHLSKEYKNRPLFNTEAWDRSFGGTLGKRNEDPKVQMADMDLDGIDIQVVFPTHLSLNSEKETALAVDIARAYNDWLAQFCSADPKRLKGVAMVALQDVDAAVREVRRAVEELGFIGVMMPTNVRTRTSAGASIGDSMKKSSGSASAWHYMAAFGQRSGCTDGLIISSRSTACRFHLNAWQQ
jgi:predicted TIM-barrel fold metal-dependent hydrolase